MNNIFITLGLSVITAGITAWITYFVSIKTTIRNKELELKREQAFKYFLPLKFSAEELYNRLAHIEKKIVEKKDVHIQLPQTLEGKNFDWYFTDWKDFKVPSSGAQGYFLVTTMFMHAQLYNRINLVLKEYPFLDIKINQSLDEYIYTSNNDQAKRCYDDAIDDEHTKKWVNIRELAHLKGEIKLERLIKFVRLAAVMKGGIPYGLQPAFGQFIEKTIDGKTEQINYEEFVRLLMDKEQRVKFSPLFSFYSEIVSPDFKVEEVKLIKMKALMLSLLIFRNVDIA